MKGVIVQAGEPKSIVLLNNGRITAIPTPDGCHVGMVVTVKYSHFFKILIISLASVLLITVGIFIGAAFFGGSEESPGTPADTMPWEPMQRHRRMMMEQHR